MKLGLSSVVILALGALALAGCSSGNEPATATSTSAAATNSPGIITRGLGTVTRTPDTVTVVIGVQTRDDGASRAQARANAVRQAKAHAKQIADAAGVTLGRIHSITEMPVNPPSPVGRDGAPAAVAPVPSSPVPRNSPSWSRSSMPSISRFSAGIRETPGSIGAIGPLRSSLRSPMTHRSYPQRAWSNSYNV
jgi:uncharacterized protein YggE